MNLIKKDFSAFLDKKNFFWENRILFEMSSNAPEIFWTNFDENDDNDEDYENLEVKDLNWESIDLEELDADKALGVINEWYNSFLESKNNSENADIQKIVKDFKNKWEDLLKSYKNWPQDSEGDFWNENSESDEWGEDSEDDEVDIDEVFDEYISLIWEFKDDFAETQPITWYSESEAYIKNIWIKNTKEAYENAISKKIISRGNVYVKEKMGFFKNEEYKNKFIEVFKNWILEENIWKEAFDWIKDVTDILVENWNDREHTLWNLFWYIKKDLKNPSSIVKKVDDVKMALAINTIQLNDEKEFSTLDWNVSDFLESDIKNLIIWDTFSWDWNLAFERAVKVVKENKDSYGELYQDLIGKVSVDIKNIIEDFW